MTQTRWAVIGTANIAATSFLPAMRAAGGRAVVVGSRDAARGRAWADANQVDRVADYADAIEADEVDAIYVALPNNEHTAWASRAVATGRAVLCEKPLGVNTADTTELLHSLPAGALLWEAFVFPFHPQTELLQNEMSELGRVREIFSEFHFTAPFEGNIRWQAASGGGALRDVGCYCIRLARLLYDDDPSAAAARAFVEHGVDAELAAVLDFPGERRLIMSVGLRGAFTTFARIIGEVGELRVTNPFHPKPGDVVQRWRDGAQVAQWTAGDKLAFQYGVEHVQAVLRGEVEPRHLAATDALGNARAIDMVEAAAG